MNRNQPAIATSSSSFGLTRAATPGDRDRFVTLRMKLIALLLVAPELAVKAAARLFSATFKLHF